ncbi:MAG: hypothetical protein CMH24_03900 [Nitrosomonadales bacterium]|nr:hypothetical protein [Nitrosomonadales bacterium]
MISLITPELLLSYFTIKPIIMLNYRLTLAIESSIFLTMKKLLLLLFLFSHLVFSKESNDLEISLIPLGDDRYNIVLIVNYSSDQIILKKKFISEVKKVCGTRYEIESNKFVGNIENDPKKMMIQGKFKCYINSQM